MVSIMALCTVVVLVFSERLMAVLYPDIAALGLLMPVREVKPTVLLDMRELRALDCSGIGLLAALYRVTRSSGGKLKLFGLRERPGLLLEDCGLLRVLDTFENEEDALASVVASDGRELYLERATACCVSHTADVVFASGGGL